MLKKLFKHNTTTYITEYIRQIVMISTVLITIGVASIITIQEYTLFHQISSQQREDHIQNQKGFIRDLINIETEYITNEEVQFKERISTLLKKNVYDAYNIAEKFHHEYSGKIPDAEIKKMVINAVASLEPSTPFAQIYINRLDGVGVYYPENAHLIGKNLVKFQDINGNLVVQKEIEAISTKDEEYLSYGNGKLGNHDGIPQNKLSFVKKFAPFDWYFGTKIYLEDYYNDFKMQIAKKISSERFKYGGYVFMNELDGDPVVLDGKIYEGDFNFYDETDSARMNVFKTEVKTVLSSPSGGYFSYFWNKIGETKKSRKISYVRYFSNCDWIIGAGFYEDEVDAELVIPQKQLKQGLFRNLIQILLVLFLVLALEVFIIHRFNKNYQADSCHFADFFRIGKDDYTKINIEQLHFGEFRNMGEIANEMIEERTKVHQRLVEEQEKAAESDRLKTAFLANMSHEIRTPMNAIIGFSSLLDSETLPDSEKAMFVNLIQQNGEILLNLINDIIDISKIESGQLNIVRRNFKLNDLLDNIADYYRGQINNTSNQIINFELDKKLPENFICNTDEFRLKQILNNLLGNAIKFTKKGTVKLIVYKNDNYVHFSIHDTGIGIPSEDIESVFERFVQAKNHYKRNYGGTGLGLAISKNLVQLLGGEIQVKSNLNQGSEFSFYIKS